MAPGGETTAGDGGAVSDPAIGGRARAARGGARRAATPSAVPAAAGAAVAGAQTRPGAVGVVVAPLSARPPARSSAGPAAAAATPRQATALAPNGTAKRSAGTARGGGRRLYLQGGARQRGVPASPPQRLAQCVRPLPPHTRGAFPHCLDGAAAAAPLLRAHAAAPAGRGGGQVGRPPHAKSAPSVTPRVGRRDWWWRRAPRCAPPAAMARRCRHRSRPHPHRHSVGGPLSPVGASNRPQHRRRGVRHGSRPEGADTGHARQHVGPEGGGGGG